MILTEGATKKLGMILEKTIEDINNGLRNRAISDDIKKLGRHPAPGVQSPEVRKTRREALTNIINNAGGKTKFYPGGKE